MSECVCGGGGGGGMTNNILWISRTSKNLHSLVASVQYSVLVRGRGVCVWDKLIKSQMIHITVL